MNNVLLLLLGCAVQGDQRDKFIERVKDMEDDFQTEILNEIKKVAENGDCIIDIRALQLDGIIPENGIQTALSNLERIIKERNTYANCLFEMSAERESDENSTTTGSSSLSGESNRQKISETRYEARTPSPILLERHTNIELASTKAELRKLRNIVEEKDEMISELRDEAEAREADLLKMQQDRLELVKDARAAKDYRDQLECLHHKLSKLEKLEVENGKYKEKLSELDFFKSRVTHLKEENEIMQESCKVLENQLEQCQRKVGNHLDLEVKLTDYQSQIKNYQLDLTKDRERMEELLVANGRLERELEGEREKVAELERHLECCIDRRSPSEKFNNSLAEQLADSENRRVLELELELRKLRTKLENGCDEEANENRTKLLRTEIQLTEKTKECDLLAQKLEQFQIKLSQISKNYQQAYNLCETLTVERDLAQQNLQEARKKFSDFQSDYARDTNNDLRAKVLELENKLQTGQIEFETLVNEKVKLEQKLTESNGRQGDATAAIEQLKVENHCLEQNLLIAEKHKRTVENDRNAQKEKNHFLEERLEESKSIILNLQKVEDKHDSCVKSLTECRSRCSELESENRHLMQQLELELNKMDRLREDLVVVKSRSSDLISRIRSICVSIQLNGGKCELPMDDEHIIGTIDDIIMSALTEARREADALRLQQHTQIAELNDLREDIQRLKRPECDQGDCDDRVRNLTIENHNIKEQVLLLQEKIREMQQEITFKSTEIISLKRDLEGIDENMKNSEKLHTEIAKLQVAMRNHQLQEELLRNDNLEMQRQIEIGEKDKLAMKADFNTLQAMHDALLNDHERLQTLHDMLANDYDEAKHENSHLKIKLKNQKGLAEGALNDRRMLEEFKLTANDAREQHERELRKIHADTESLRIDHERLRNENQMLIGRCQVYDDQNRKLHHAEETQRAINDNLSGKIDELQRILQVKELEISKLLHKIEMLDRLNRTLEVESRSANKQMDQLIGQNHNLLVRALGDNDEQNLITQNELQKKLYALRQRKGIIEGKVSEQFRILETTSPVNRDQPTLIKRAAKALISKTTGKKMANGGSAENSPSATEESSTLSADDMVAPNWLKASDRNGYRYDFEVQACSSSDEAFILDCELAKCHNGSATHSDSEAANRMVARGIAQPECASIRQATPTNYQERSIDVLSLNGSERAVDVPSPKYHALPPRPPSRGGSAGRTGPSTNGGGSGVRVLPPPYPPKASPKACHSAKPKKPPPPPYPGKNVNLMPYKFEPINSSTPNGHQDCMDNSNGAVGEGEFRTMVRDKEERTERAMSIYENVNNHEVIRNQTINTVWYEYGCV